MQGLDRLRTLLGIIIIFVIPVLFLYFRIIPDDQYLVVLAIYTSFVLLVVFREEWSFKKLHIRSDNIRTVLLPYIIFTLLGIVALLFLSEILQVEREISSLYFLFLGWSIPTGIIQEFLYRGFLVHELKRMYASAALVVFINALIFALLHIIYNPPIIILPLTFIAGIGFVWMYMKYPNLLMVSISHGILNFVAIYLGFF